MLKSAIAWSAVSGPVPSGNPSLHRALAIELCTTTDELLVRLLLIPPLLFHFFPSPSLLFISLLLSLSVSPHAFCFYSPLPIYIFIYISHLTPMDMVFHTTTDKLAILQ